MEARSQGFGVRQTDLDSNCNPLLVSLVALLVPLSCSIAICETGVRTVSAASDCWEATKGEKRVSSEYVNSLFGIIFLRIL